MAQDVFHGLEGDVRVSDDTIIVTYYNAPAHPEEVPKARQLASVNVETIFERVAGYYDVSAEIFASRGDPHVARAVAAWLARRYSSVTLRELAPRFGLSRPDSVCNLTRRIDRLILKNQNAKAEISEIEKRLR